MPKSIYIGVHVEPGVVKKLDAVRKKIPYNPSRGAAMREALMAWLQIQAKAGAEDQKAEGS